MRKLVVCLVTLCGSLSVADAEMAPWAIKLGNLLKPGAKLPKAELSKNKEDYLYSRDIEGIKLPTLGIKRKDTTSWFIHFFFDKGQHVAAEDFGAAQLCRERSADGWDSPRYRLNSGPFTDAVLELHTDSVLLVSPSRILNDSFFTTWRSCIGK